MYLGEIITDEKHFLVTFHNGQKERLVTEGVAKRAIKAGFGVFDAKERKILSFYNRVSLLDFLGMINDIVECLEEDMFNFAERLSFAKEASTIALEAWDWVLYPDDDKNKNVTFMLTELNCALDDGKTEIAKQIVTDITEMLK